MNSGLNDKEMAAPERSRSETYSRQKNLSRCKTLQPGAPPHLPNKCFLRAGGLNIHSLSRDLWHVDLIGIGRNKLFQSVKQFRRIN